MTLMPRRLALLTVVLALSAAALPPAAPAARVTVGVGDQDWGTFLNGHFTELGLKHARVVTPWNVALSDADGLWLDDYLTHAQAAGV